MTDAEKTQSFLKQRADNYVCVVFRLKKFSSIRCEKNYVPETIICGINAAG